MGNRPDPEFIRRAFRGDAEVRWQRQFPDPAHFPIFVELADAYQAPGRHYHNLQHIRDCFLQTNLCFVQLDDYRAVDAAIWFHDVVYDPTRSDNEERSADWADQRLLAMGRSSAFVATVRELILDTRHKAPPTTPDGKYVVDIDLSIFGRPTKEFDAYDRAIRLEYAHVSDEAYRVGRAAVLQAFLARQTIYHTPQFLDRYEEPARANLARAIANLQTS